MKFTSITLIYYIFLSIIAYAQQSTISGVVWVDSNKDGIRQVSEERVENARVRLYFDKNNEGIVERVVDAVMTNANGEYTFSNVGTGKFQVGIDILKLPDDLYELAQQNIGNDESLDNDVSKHTLRTDEFVITAANETHTNISDIGIEQGDDQLNFQGIVTSYDIPAEEWLYQDLLFMLDVDVVGEPTDTVHQENVKKWMKWYATAERITQEAELLDNYYSLARRSNYAHTNNRNSYTIPFPTKHLHTQQNLGSWAGGRANTSSGIPVTGTYDQYDRVVNHQLMFYEITRGINPIWKYRATWPYAARLSHYVLAAMAHIENGGAEVLDESPDWSWNVGIFMGNLDLWEISDYKMVDVFSDYSEYHQLNGWELQNCEVYVPHPQDPNQTWRIDSRQILASIIMQVLIDYGRERAIEVLHNMSSKKRFSSSAKESLIAFKQAVNDATDGAYDSKFDNEWGFPTEDVYGDTRTIDTGVSPNLDSYRFDMKPHTFRASDIRPGYAHLSERTTQGVARWIENNNSRKSEIGAYDQLLAVTNYPHDRARLVLGEGSTLRVDLKDGLWKVGVAIYDGSPFHFDGGDLIEVENSKTFYVNVTNGYVDIRYPEEGNSVQLELDRVGNNIPLNFTLDDNNDNQPVGIDYFVGHTDANPVTIPPVAFASDDSSSWVIPYDPSARTKWKIQTSPDLKVWRNYTAADTDNVTVNSSQSLIEFNLPAPATAQPHIYYRLSVVGFPNNLTQQAGVTALQSTTGWGGNAERAIDGNTDGNMNKGSVTHTQNENGAWWQVDLGSRQKIEEIVIWNRTDSQPHRLTNFRVSVIDENGAVLDFKDFYTTVGHAAEKETWVLKYVEEGQVVRVEKLGGGYLSLAEIQVF